MEQGKDARLTVYEFLMYKRRRNIYVHYNLFTTRNKKNANFIIWNLQDSLPQKSKDSPLVR